jgi:ribose 5-phosphate isomerase B
MAKKLISESSILNCVKRGEKIIILDSDTIVTDVAKEKAKQFGIQFSQKTSEQPDIKSSTVPTKINQNKNEVIALGSDHGGFQLKEIIKQFLESLGYKVVDVGAFSDEACDYPDFAYTVARMVSSNDAAKGIMIDAVGIASAIVANKVKGIRAACCYNEFSARSSREHNNANVLTLGGRVLGSELAKSIVRVWLDTEFAGGRHQPRLDKILEIEIRLGKQ